MFLRGGLPVQLPPSLEKIDELEVLSRDFLSGLSCDELQMLKEVLGESILFVDQILSDCLGEDHEAFSIYALPLDLFSYKDQETIQEKAVEAACSQRTILYLGHVNRDRILGYGWHNPVIDRAGMVFWIPATQTGLAWLYGGDRYQDLDARFKVDFTMVAKGMQLTGTSREKIRLAVSILVETGVRAATELQKLLSLHSATEVRGEGRQIAEGLLVTHTGSIQEEFQWHVAQIASQVRHGLSEQLLALTIPLTTEGLAILCEAYDLTQEQRLHLMQQLAAGEPLTLEEKEVYRLHCTAEVAPDKPDVQWELENQETLSERDAQILHMLISAFDTTGEDPSVAVDSKKFTVIFEQFRQACSSLQARDAVSSILFLLMRMLYVDVHNLIQEMEE
jgi:hypothetical protein